MLLLASIAPIVLGQIGGAASADAQNDSVERHAGCSGPTAQGYPVAEAVTARAHARERPYAPRKWPLEATAGYGWAAVWGAIGAAAATSP
jgi:hypothetical protein